MTQSLRYAAASRPSRWPAIAIAAALGAVGGFSLSLALGMNGYEAEQTSQVVDDVVELADTQSYERRIERLKEEIQQLNAENSALRDRIEGLDFDKAALQSAERRLAELEVELASHRGTEQVTPPPSAPGGLKQFENGLVLVSGGGKPTERNDTWWRYSWQFTFANHSDKPVVFNLEVRFLDSQGFVVDKTKELGLSIPPRTNKSFRGDTLITSGPAHNVTSVDPKVEIKG